MSKKQSTPTPVFETLADAELLAYTTRTMATAPYLEELIDGSTEMRHKMGLVRKSIEVAYERRDLGLLRRALRDHLKFVRLAVTKAALEQAEEAVARGDTGKTLELPGIEDLNEWL